MDLISRDEWWDFSFQFCVSEWYGERKRTHKGIDCAIQRDNRGGECGSGGREVAQAPMVK